MTVLVIGGAGHIGGLVVDGLAATGVEVCTLDTDASAAPRAGVEQVVGDVCDIDMMRELLRRVSTVFVLNPVVADETTRALLTLRLIEEAGIRRVVYLSMINADILADVPHAAAKAAAERAIARLRLPATILRPNYFFQNDLAQLASLTTRGQYTAPLGGIGVAMIDARDVAAIAAAELVRRELSELPLPTETIDVVGSDTFTGATMVRLWSEVLGLPITYAEETMEAAEAKFRGWKSPAMAYDTALMFAGFLTDGMIGAPGAGERLAERLGRPLRTYRDFAEEAAANWRGRPARLAHLTEAKA